MTAKISGYACVTDVPYQVGPFTERVAQGAFKRTIGENPDLVLLVTHRGLPMARTKAGSLKVAEDDTGLHFSADVDDSRSDVVDLLRAMGRGDISECSFGFQVTDQTWTADYRNRLIRAVSLHRGDVSICSYGANPSTFSSVAQTADLATRRRTAEMVGRSFRGSTEFRAKVVERVDSDLVVATLEYRGPSSARLRKCSRCQTTGRVTLGGRTVPCPNCAGKGHRVTTSGPADGPHASTAADGSSRSLRRRLDQRRILEKRVLRGRSGSRLTSETIIRNARAEAERVERERRSSISPYVNQAVQARVMGARRPARLSPGSPEWRAAMSTAEINNLPDSAFAYIEPGGKKDGQGKTVPRSLRHYPIHDAAHVRDALARAAAAIAGDNATAKAIAEKAMPKIKAAAKKFGIDA